jgi:hypothetical protein
MATSIILPNFDTRYHCEIINNRFAPKLKYDNSQYFSSEKENYELNSDFEQNDENNKVSKMSYLFPSVPIEVSINHF